MIEEWDRFAADPPWPPTRRRLLQGAAAAGVLGALPAARGSAGRGGAAGSGGPLQDDRLDWFLDAKFGMFVHWGPYSVAGVEASWPIMVPGLTGLLGPDQRIAEADYEALAKRFDPKAFRPRDWIRFARRAGMRYLVVTAKHHDGYCLFDAPGTEYKSTRGPSGRDLIAELADACAAESFPLGFYYSPPDMHHPGYRDTSRPVRENWTGEPERAEWSEFVDVMDSQIEALLTHYGPVRVVWFDGLFDHDRYQPARLIRTIRRLQPNCLVNDRLGWDHADFVTPEQAVPEGVLVRRDGPALEVGAEQFRGILEMIASGTDPAAFQRLLEQSMRVRFPSEPLPESDRFQPWEACMTVGATWAFDPLHRALKSPDELLRVLLDVVSRGGNLLLNLGPDPDGRLPEPEAARALELGAWLRRNEEAIYGTTYGRWPGLEGVRATRPRRGEFAHERDYLIPLDPEQAVEIRLEPAGSERLAPTRAFRLEDRVALQMHSEGGHLRLSLPHTPSDGAEPASANQTLSNPVFVLDTEKE